MNTKHSFSRRTQEGFTLVEFMVASAMALALCVAIGVIYFYTSRLNSVASTQLKVEKELRQVSLDIKRDASMAGNFGCLSLTSLYQNDSRNIDNEFNRTFHVLFNPNIDSNKPYVFDRPSSTAKSTNQNFGVSVIPASKLQVDNFDPQGKALIFYYGIGDASLKSYAAGSDGDRFTALSFQDEDPKQYLKDIDEQGGFFALSSCKALNIFQTTPHGSSDAKGAIELTQNTLGDVRLGAENRKPTNYQQISEMQLLRYIVHAYAVGRNSEGHLGLYRIELASDGRWGPPVLISRYVGIMDVSFIYSTALNNEKEPIGCPSAFNDDVFASEDESLEHKFNNYQFYEKDNATFNKAVPPTDPKGERTQDIKEPLKDEHHYLAPAAVNIVFTLNLPHIAAPFGRGLQADDKTKSKEGSQIDIKSGLDLTNKTYRIFSSIRGGNRCANRNLLD